MSLTGVYRVGLWFGFIRFALLLAVVLCWVARCFGSWVLLGLFFHLRVTQGMAHAEATTKQELTAVHTSHDNAEACKPPPPTDDQHTSRHSFPVYCKNAGHNAL